MWTVDMNGSLVNLDKAVSIRFKRDEMNHTDRHQVIADMQNDTGVVLCRGTRSQCKAVLEALRAVVKHNGVLVDLRPWQGSENLIPQEQGA